MGVLAGGVGQAAEHRQAPGHSIRARGQPLVRQGLPGGQHSHGVGLVFRQVGAHGGGEFVGPAASGGDHHYRAVLGDVHDQRGAHAYRGDQIDLVEGLVAGGAGLDGLDRRRIPRVFPKRREHT